MKWVDYRAMRRVVLAGVALASAMPTLAHAEFKTGNQVLEMCNNGSQSVWYVMGVFDAYETIPFAQDARICPPPGVKSGQVSDVACKFIRDNPAIRHTPGAALVGSALRKAWPCR